MPVQCVIRDSGNSNLITHKRMHGASGPYNYDVCNEAFRLKCLLVTHVPMHNSNNQGI